MSQSHLSFQLSSEFVDSYSDREVDWGFPIGGGNSLGEIIFITTYSLLKEDGTKERWHETCRRVVEGTYSILKNHCEQNKTPWYHPKAQKAAQEMYERMFTFKWLPPGRGLFKMGTPFVFEEGSASLQNCAFLSTEKLGPREPTLPFIRMMEMSMLGIGVGFDLKGAGGVNIHRPTGDPITHVVGDSREGWCDSVDALLRSFFVPGQKPVRFDYSPVRDAGLPLKRFGGVSAGPGPLKELHAKLTVILAIRAGNPITEETIADVMNLIGKAVVAGSLRRSSQIAFGSPDDKTFVNLKNPHINPERMGVTGFTDDGWPIYSEDGGWGQLSNNSVIPQPGENLDHLVDSIAMNGEPGIYYLHLAQGYGRMKDGPKFSPQDPHLPFEYRVKGSNPCVEQPLEPHELCTLVETFPFKHESLEDYKRTLKVAYLYGKAVTLLPTHWPESNEVMQRNRRIGLSMSGIVQFVESRGVAELRRWCDEGYAEVNRRDVQYSEWMGVRESIKKTSVKPSGTVSLLVGATPGVHNPPGGGTGRWYIRRKRMSAADPVVPVLEAAGYHVEPDVMDPNFTVVCEFPTMGPDVRSEREVSVWEKVHLAVLMQEWWADNMVSATFSFTPEETHQIGPIIRMTEGSLKAMSFLPLGPETSKGAYAQMPYEGMSEAEYLSSCKTKKRFDVDAMYSQGIEAIGEKFCSNDVCEIPAR